MNFISLIIECIENENKDLINVGLECLRIIIPIGIT